MEGGRMVVMEEAGGQGGEIFISNFCYHKYLLFKWKIFFPPPSIIPIVKQKNKPWLKKQAASYGLGEHTPWERLPADAERLVRVGILDQRCVCPFSP